MFTSVYVCFWGEGGGRLTGWKNPLPLYYEKASSLFLLEVTTSMKYTEKNGWYFFKAAGNKAENYTGKKSLNLANKPLDY